MNVYQIHPRKDHRGIDLISDALPFGALFVIETHEHKGEFKEP